MALKGIKVIEMAGLAPVPFCGMILADFGANVIRVDKVKQPVTVDVLGRGKRSIVIDLKQDRGVGILKNLCKTADVLIDSFRPGVMEKYGLGPNDLEILNKQLIYARLTGYGQFGPMKSEAGHDINYLALSGVLSKLGRCGEKPYAPINLLADFAGGGVICAMGIVMALLERVSSGKGQTVDCSMVEGSAYVGSWLWRASQLFIWGNERGKNWIDGGAAFYDTYETKDGKYLSVGCIEPEFYDKFVKALGDDGSSIRGMSQFDMSGSLKAALTDIFLKRTREEWCQVFTGTDACVTPVLDMDEAAAHPHNAARGSFLSVSGEPRPAPVLSRSPGAVGRVSDPVVGEHSVEVLREVGCYSERDILGLIRGGVVEHRLQPDRGEKSVLEKHWSKAKL